MTSPCFELASSRDHRLELAQAFEFTGSYSSVIPTDKARWLTRSARSKRGPPRVRWWPMRQSRTPQPRISTRENP